MRRGSIALMSACPTTARAGRFRNRCAVAGEDGETAYEACRYSCHSCDKAMERQCVDPCLELSA